MINPIKPGEVRITTTYRIYPCGKREPTTTTSEWLTPSGIIDQAFVSEPSIGRKPDPEGTTYVTEVTSRFR